MKQRLSFQPLHEPLPKRQDRQEKGWKPDRLGADRHNRVRHDLRQDEKLHQFPQLRVLQLTALLNQPW